MNRTGYPGTRILFYSLLIAAGFLSACKKEKVPPISLHYDYFPVTRGSWVIYNVDSIYHAETDNDNDDSVYAFHFQEMYMLDSTYIDASGNEAQVLLRYKRNTSGDEWTFASAWTQSLNLSSAYRTEENVRYHKLAFPISEDINWDGNDGNIHDEEMYHYLSVHEQQTINTLSFDSTITILQRDDNNYVEKIYGKEIYANGVGMVFKERDDLGKRNGVVVSGLEYKMIVVDYGR